MLRTLFFLLTLIVLSVPGISARAQPVGNIPLPISKPSPYTPIAEQLNQQLQSIIGGTTSTASPAANNNSAAPPAQQPSNAAAATTSTTTAGPPAPDEANEPGETFGTKALSLVLGIGNVLVVQGAAFAENFADLPQVSDWLTRQMNDPLKDRWNAAGQDLLMTVGIAFLAAFVFQLLLLPVRRHLRRRAPANFVRRFMIAFGILVIELLPVIVFIGVSLALLNEYETQKLPRFVVLNVIYALTLNRLIMLVGQMLLAPRSDTGRLIPVAKETARYLYRWLGFFSFISVYGYFLIDVAHSVHVPVAAINAFRSLLVLTLVIMTIIVIVQKRSSVALFLRGHLSAAQRDLSPWQSLRLWFARSWHILAIAYLVIGYVVTALGVDGAFAVLLRGTVLTFLILMLTGLSFHNLRRHDARHEVKGGQSGFHHMVLRYFSRGGIWLAAAVGIAYAWGANIPALLATPFGHRLTGSLFSIGVTVLVLTLIYKFFNAAVETHLNREDDNGQVTVSARARTLLPMLRNTAFIVFTIIIGMVVMSEIGISIWPLMASAGVIGVAIGFGSQTLIKDFLTGLFIVLEGSIAVGDVVQIGEHKGVVEMMHVRTLRLRDADGAVHTLPYGEVTNFINMTKDFSYVLTNINVAYNSDLRRVMEVIKEVGEELRQDPKFSRSIIDPIEVLGVDKFGDSSIVMQSRIRTRPGRQWDVKRAFLLRLKERFDAEKIVIPYPTSMQYSQPLLPPAKQGQ